MSSNKATASRRISWVALALSFLAAGVGHLYCGKMAKGLLLYFAWLLLPICIAISVLMPASTANFLLLLLLPVVVVASIYLYAAFDAWRTASRIGAYSLLNYNRVSVYWMMIGAQIVFSTGMIAVTNGIVYEAFLIPTRSMNPTILKGDLVLANKVLLANHGHARGDLIVYKNPTSQGGDTFIGRVVATEGDEIRIEGESVFVNGEELERESVPAEQSKPLDDQESVRVKYETNSGTRYLVSFEETSNKSSEAPDIEATVPEKCVYVLGDNRNLCRDSRHFGALQIGDIVGRVKYIYWPPESWSRFSVTNDNLP
jgi:signal peptidase I